MIHLVWSTKNRTPFLRNEIRQVILDHIRSNSVEKGIHIDFMNCHLDHVHCLVSLDIDQNIAKVVNLLKGESSHWINQQKMVRGKFSWQDEYFAVSVSESNIARVREYIRNQEEHHKKKTFQDEFDEFFRIFQFQKMA
jgi:REP element-mobilizing transposase RayT